MAISAEGPESRPFIDRDQLYDDGECSVEYK